jgi:hypothetical protein
MIPYRIDHRISAGHTRSDAKPIADDSGLNPKDGAAAARSPDSERAKLLSALTQDRECFQRNNEWLKSEAERWSNVVDVFQKAKKMPNLRHQRRLFFSTNAACLLMTVKGTMLSCGSIRFDDISQLC